MRRKTIITIGIILIALAIIAGIVVVLIERKNSQIPEQVKPETTESADTDTPEATHGGTSTETETVTGFEEIEKTENLAYKLNDDGSGYTVTGIGTCTDKDVIIPETYRGKPVVAIGEGAFAGVTLETISFAKNIKSIGSNAFYGCKNLEIDFYGSKSDWKAVSKPDNWNEALKEDNYKIYVTEPSNDDWGIPVE